MKIKTEENGPFWFLFAVLSAGDKVGDREGPPFVTLFSPLEEM